MSGVGAAGFAGDMDMVPLGWAADVWAAAELCCAKIGAVAKVSARLRMLSPRDGNLVGEIAAFTGPEWVGVGCSCRRHECEVTKSEKRRRFTGHSICIS